MVDCGRVLVLRYDLRIPPHLGTDAAAQHRACLDQVRWGERCGFDMVVLSEHHGADDGFMPAPLTVAAAIAGATSRIGINLSALLVTMHDPVRLAEQLATVDLLSGGRLSVVLGTGYRQEEFDMAGIAYRDRYRVLEEHVAVMRRAWTGEELEWQGRRIRVRPVPATPGGPLLMLGGSTEGAARRAARMGLPFSAAVGDPALAAAYDDECAAAGTAGFAILPPADLPGFVHVSDDPEHDWARIAPYALHEAHTYALWQRPGQRSAVHTPIDATADDLRAGGVYRVVTPDECVDLYRSLGALVLHPLMGGLPPDLAAESLDRFEHQVLPRLGRPTASA